jgi:hypothetical protein
LPDIIKPYFEKDVREIAHLNHIQPRHIPLCHLGLHILPLYWSKIALAYPAVIDTWQKK